MVDATFGKIIGGDHLSVWNARREMASTWIIKLNTKRWTPPTNPQSHPAGGAHLSRGNDNLKIFNILYL